MLHIVLFFPQHEANTQKEKWQFKILEVKYCQAQSSKYGQSNYSANSARIQKQPKKHSHYP